MTKSKKMTKVDLGNLRSVTRFLWATLSRGPRFTADPDQREGVTLPFPTRTSALVNKWKSLLDEFSVSEAKAEFMAEILETYAYHVRTVHTEDSVPLGGSTSLKTVGFPALARIMATLSDQECAHMMAILKDAQRSVERLERRIIHTLLERAQVLIEGEDLEPEDDDSDPSTLLH